MATMREWIIQWTGPGSTPKLSVLYADNSFTAADQAGAINTLLLAYKPYMNVLYSAQTRAAIRLVDSDTGELVGLDTFTPAPPVTGSSSGQPVADSSQVLLRWATGQIVNGRFVQGRTFLPGLGVGNLNSGNVAPAVVTAMSTAAQAFALSTAGFGVWHRPKDDALGDHFLLQGGSCWNEVAVQRGRRG